jgi:hypothetical protein
MGLHNKDEYSQNNLTLLFGALALVGALAHNWKKSDADKEPVKRTTAAAAQVMQVSVPASAASAPARK